MTTMTTLPVSRTLPDKHTVTLSASDQTCMCTHDCMTGDGTSVDRSGTAAFNVEMVVIKSVNLFVAGASSGNILISWETFSEPVLTGMTAPALVRAACLAVRCALI